MISLTARRRALAQTVLVAVAVGAGALTLTKVVWSGSWTTVVLGSLALVVAAVAGTRWVAQSRGSGPLATAAPTLVGTVLAAVLWVGWGTSAAVKDPNAAPLPDGAVAAAFTALGRLHDLAAQSVAPIDATAPVLSAILSATLALYLLGDVLAVTLRSPVAAAVPALVLWLPSLVIVSRVPVGCVAATLLALLVLLAVSRQDARAHTRDGAAATVGVVGVAAVVTVASLVVGAGAVAVQQGGARPLADLFGSGSTSGRLGNNLDVLRDLGDRPDTVVMTLRASDPSATVGPLRVYTLTEFDGSSWNPDALLRGAKDVVPGEVLGSGTPTGSDAFTVRVTPELLPKYRLAVSTDPRAVRSSSASPLRYDEERDEVYRVSGDADAPYTLVVHPRDLTATELKTEQAQFGSDSGLPETLRRQALELPDTAHLGDVKALAEKLTADAPTDFDKALALQTYFRDVQRFTYSTKAPRGSSDAVWAFLQSREGYCVQFATAMAIMLRTLGIPTRVGVGYLTRAPGDDGLTRVTGQDAHAWPEVYFEGSGWVRFEPTPAVQSGIAPSYTDLYSGQTSSSQGNSDIPSARASAPDSEASAEPSESAAAATIGTPATRRDSHLVLVVSVALLLVLAGAAVALAVGRRRRGRPIGDAEEAWDSLRRRLASEGVTWPDSATPRQVPELVAGAVHDAHGVLDDDTRRALDELSRAVESERYARPDAEQRVDAERTPTAVRWANLVDDVVAGVQSEVSGRPRGGDAPSAPRGERGTTRAS